MAAEHVTGEVLAPPPRPLTPQMLQAAVADAAGGSRKQIASISGASEGSVNSWRKNEAYRAEVERLRGVQVDHITEPIRRMKSELVEGVRDGIKTLRAALNAMDSKDERPNWGIRTNAAELLLKHGIELHQAEAAAQANSQQSAPVQAIQVIVNTGDGPPSPNDIQR